MRHIHIRGWNDVKKSLPTSFEIVLVTNGRVVGLGFIGCRFYPKKIDRTNVFTRPVSLDALYDIVAWKRIPKVPKKYRKVI